MTRRVCPTPGCGNFQPCSTHARASSTARGYGRLHRNLRAEWAPRVAAGLVECWRCGERIQPSEVWDLGHVDPTTYGGPEHAGRCNRSAAGKAAHEHN